MLSRKVAAKITRIIDDTSRLLPLKIYTSILLGISEIIVFWK